VTVFASLNTETTGEVTTRQNYTKKRKTQLFRHVFYFTESSRVRLPAVVRKFCCCSVAAAAAVVVVVEVVVVVVVVVDIIIYHEILQFVLQC